MSSVDRRSRIMEDLEQRGHAETAELSRRFNVSDMTIRRDLDALQAEGRVRRTHGGVTLAQVLGVEPRYAAKQRINATLKARIARHAVEEFVVDGDVLLLEGGTTVTAMVPHLRARHDVTVVTNGLYTANQLSLLLPQLTVLSTGGLLRDASFTYVGPTAEAFFDTFRGNKLFISATGLTLRHGLTEPNPLEVAVRKRMVAAVDQVIALVDSSKFGVVSLVPTVAADGVDILITDAGAPKDDLDALRHRGVEVRVVD